MESDYLPCPICNTDMKRTGNKGPVRERMKGEKEGMFKIEYECLKCGRVWTYDESRRLFY